MVLELEGRARDFFLNETGIHRWMRVPPTEKRGRVHTSSVSVALVEALEEAPAVDRKDVREWVTRGTGPGGQHRNKVETVVVLVHEPTGTKITCGETRSQGENRLRAWQRLQERLNEIHRGRTMDARSASRQGQVGNGGRGEKRRTYRERDDLALDHVTGRQCRLRDWSRGRLSALHRE